ncbi:MAG: isoprenylcysteine carboxylmethyltransferase family protein [Candidatus Thorarchaeota archaeon]
MYEWFIFSVIGTIIVVPLHFWSVKHHKLETKYGEKRGRRIGSILGMVSGWGYFIFLAGLWFSPQDRLVLPIPEILIIEVPVILLSMPLTHLILAVIFIIPGAWLGIKGVKDVTLKVSETHRPEEVVATGIYARIRHPQYLGALLSHLGVTFVMSALFSMLVTPLIISATYITAWKEEKELIREFGGEYEDYRSHVPMFIPKLRASKSEKPY